MMDPLPTLDLEALANLRQDCFRLFAVSFLYPSKDRALRLAAVAARLAQADGLLPAFPFYERLRRLLVLVQSSSERDVTELEERYVHLFEGNFSCPPWESAFLDPRGRAAGRIAAQLEGEYADGGVRLASALHEPPDHVAVELDFMAFLCDREARRWADHDVPGGLEIVERERAFLGRHLGRWIPKFARRIAIDDRVEFYGVAGDAVSAFVHHDPDLLGVLVNRLGASPCPS